MGLLGMAMSDAPKKMAMPSGPAMMKPKVDMAGKRKPLRPRPKKVQAKPAMPMHKLKDTH